jgi:hypothetical protein
MTCWLINCSTVLLEEYWPCTLWPLHRKELGWLGHYSDWAADGMNRVKFLVGKDFCLCCNVQTSSHANPVSCQVGTRVLCSGVRWLRH